MTEPTADLGYDGLPKFDGPRLHYGWRMPIRRLAWELGWWLLLHVTLRDYTGPQRVWAVREALGPFKDGSAGIAIGSSSKTVTITGCDFEVLQLITRELR